MFRAVWYQLLTITPSIGSAGWDGHQATTLHFFPVWLSMFQTAFDFRLTLVMGRTDFPSGVGSLKPWMPCLYGLFPVPMELQSIGLRAGWRVELFP